MCWMVSRNCISLSVKIILQRKKVIRRQLSIKFKTNLEKKKLFDPS